MEECQDHCSRIPISEYKDRSIAYFTMEIGLEPDVPTYAGGLGILAGDTVKSFADLHVPAVAVSLIHRKGYFRQKLDDQGNQTEEDMTWPLAEYLQECEPRVSVYIEDREIIVRAFQYGVSGTDGYVVPVYFLDTDLPENQEEDRKLTHHLYGGDQKYRLSQEIVLGIGGARILKALKHDKLQKYHMNEGHASLLTLELIKELGDVNVAREKCVFTTHTPVPAGHDQFDQDLVKQLMGEDFSPRMLEKNLHEGKLNMTLLGLNHSSYVNGVAKKHGEVSRSMFPGYAIHSITNGVHVNTWLSDPYQRLFNQYIPGWQLDSFLLRSAIGIPSGEIWNAHFEAKKKLIDYVKDKCGEELDYDTFTIGFARRFATYKRGDLLLKDIEWLKKIAETQGPIQIIYSGKAHPKDESGKEIIRKIIQTCKDLHNGIKLVFLPDYNMEIAQMMTAGVDVWLNTPRQPMEASGTSGMKAAINGVLNCSVLDGWWIEGCVENLTGWSIGCKDSCNIISDDDDAKTLYERLEQVILPKYYKDREGWINMMKHSIAINGSFFNTQRMVQQYVVNAYLD